MNKVKRIVFALLLVAASFPLSAQEKTEAGNGYIFHFVAGKDMFFTPWSGNGKELERLLAAIEKNRAALDAGNMFLCVTSYGTDAGGEQSAEEMAKIRRNRVKSELIVRGKVKECHFVTDKSLSESYMTAGTELRNVVVVMLPSPVEKVAEIAGEEAAAKVEAYNRKNNGEAEAEKARQTEVQRIATGKAEAERIAKEQAEQKRLAEEKAAQERAEQERIAAEQAEQARLAAEKAQATPYHFALRANLLRWATLTPDLGIEWRINRNVGVLVNGSWTSWTWDNKDRRYALWEVSPEVHYYIGKEKRGYVGAMFKAGQCNYKFSATGKQGDLMGGGITGGYQLKLNKALSLDFSLGLGYMNTDVENYKVIEGVRVRQGNETKHWFGPIQAGVTLVWNIF